MKNYKLIISTPNGNYYEGEANALYLRGTEGDFAILAGHVPFVTAVVPCDLRVVTGEGEEKKGKCEGGILTVSKETVTFLSTSFKWI